MNHYHINGELAPQPTIQVTDLQGWLIRLDK